MVLIEFVRRQVLLVVWLNLVHLIHIEVFNGAVNLIVLNHYGREFIHQIEACPVDGLLPTPLLFAFMLWSYFEVFS